MADDCNVSNSEELKNKVKLFLFFSKWDLSMVKWYLEIAYRKYGNDTFTDLLQECEFSVNKSRREENLPKLYQNVAESIPLLSKFIVGYDYEEVKTKYESCDDVCVFMQWLEENIKESCKDIYNLYLMGCMNEWIYYLQYSKPQEDKEDYEIPNLCEKEYNNKSYIEEYLGGLKTMVRELSKSDIEFIKLIRKDYHSRKEHGEEYRNKELCLQMLNDGSLFTLFDMLNDSFRPEENAKREHKNDIMTLIMSCQIGNYLQDKYKEYKLQNPGVRILDFTNRYTGNHTKKHCVSDKNIKKENEMTSFFVEKLVPFSYEEHDYHEIKNVRSILKNVLKECLNWEEPQKGIWNAIWYDTFLFIREIGLINPEIQSGDNSKNKNKRYKHYQDKVIKYVCPNYEGKFHDNYLGKYDRNGGRPKVADKEEKILDIFLVFKTSVINSFKEEEKKKKQ